MKEISDKIKIQRLEKTNERLSVKAMILGFWHNISLLRHNSIIFTFIKLATSPGRSINRVIDGYRKYLYGSLEYLLFSATLIVILNDKFHFYLHSYSSLVHKFDQIKIEENFIQSFFSYAEKYPEIVNLIAIPLFALICLVVWPGRKYNFGEMLVANSFIAAQQMYFLILLVPFFYFFPSLRFSIIMPVYFAICVVYNIWVYVSLFNGNIILSFIKAVAAVLTGYFLQLPINILIFSVLGPYIGIVDIFK